MPDPGRVAAQLAHQDEALGRRTIGETGNDVATIGRQDFVLGSPVAAGLDAIELVAEDVGFGSAIGVHGMGRVVARMPTLRISCVAPVNHAFRSRYRARTSASGAEKR